MVNSIKQNSADAVLALISQDKPLDKEQIVSLQENLEVLGHFHGGTYPRVGPKTNKAILDYLKETPEAIKHANPAILRRMLGFGHEKALKEIVKNTPDFQERIHDQLKTLEAEKNTTQALNNSTDYKGIYNLQTLLTLDGHNPGGLDGIVGSKTLGAVNRYLEETKPDIKKAVVKEETIISPIKPFNEAAVGEHSINPTSTIPKIQSATNTHANEGYTKVFEGENGYGVQNIDIERAWSVITGEKTPELEFGNIPTGIINNSRPLIVIDLGHGSDIGGNDKIDPGAISKHIDGMSEVRFVDSIAQTMAEQLYRRGYQVAFTRNPGEQLRTEGSYSRTLHTRPDFAHALAKEIDANGIIFISSHGNSSKNEKANGTRIYVDVDGINTIRPESEALAKSLSEEFSLQDEGTAIKHIGNISVIDRFERNIAKTDKISAAVLIETGFLSHKEDAKAMLELMRNPEEKMNDLANGIELYVQQQFQIQQNIDSTIAHLNKSDVITPP